MQDVGHVAEDILGQLLITGHIVNWESAPQPLQIPDLRYADLSPVILHTSAFSLDVPARYISTRHVKNALAHQKTRFSVLGMLTLQPMSGYDIRKTVDASISHFWNESYGQIYPILKSLVNDGLVVRSSGNGSRNRQEYAITEKGRTALEEWLAASPRKDPVRNELLLKLFFGRNAPLERSLNHLEEYRRSQVAELQHFRSMARDLLREHSTHRDLPYWLVTLRFGIRHCEATIRWSADALRELQRSAHRRRKAGRT